MEKRSYGSGGLRFASGTWYVIARDSSGKQRTKKLIDPYTGKKPKNKSHAARLATREAEIIAGKTSVKVVYLKDLYERYMQVYSGRHHPETERNRNSSMKSFIEWFPKISMIDFNQFQGWCKHRFETPTFKKTKRKNSAVNREVAFLKTVLNWGVGEGLIESNPLKEFPKFKEDKHRERVLTDEEETRLLNSLEKKRFEFIKPIVILALFTGMRRGEIFGLKWEDVINLGNDRYGFYLSKTKTNRNRIVPIPKKVLEILPEKDKGLIFKSPKTKRKLNNIQKSWKSLLKDAEIDSFSFHDLRHCAATKMSMKGVELKVLQEIFGWCDLGMVERYVNPSVESKIKAIDLISD